MAVLRTENLIKEYPGCIALNDVTVSFESGKVNALLGKNGSGKSTLVKCFAGAIQPTHGSFYLDDEKLHFNNPSEANQKGISTVYQEMSLIPGLTVAENILLGRLPKLPSGVIDWKKAHQTARDLLQRMNVNISSSETVNRLSMWQCQVVEITKAMSFNPKVLMLDEPTSALASNEVSKLFEVIRTLRDQGVIIIYISHKLQEIPEIADTVSVLRDGEVTGSANMKDITHKDIIHMMFGEVEIHSRPKDIEVSPETVLEVKNLSYKDRFSDVSFSLRKGEVLGIAGMLGSGRTELLKCIFGAYRFSKGEIWVHGKRVNGPISPITMKRRGIGLTPEDRKLEGLILMHSIQDNLCYASMDKTSHGWIEDRQLRNAASQRQVRDLEIKVPDIVSQVSSLSGGNQQKVVVGNWLNTEPAIMLYDEPSRGIDVSAKQQIFEIMWAQARKGISTIFVSSELEELLEVCHRLLIMYRGRIVGELNPDELKIDDLYTICMGGKV